MKTWLGIAVGVLFCAQLARAQPLLSQEELRALPLDTALVLDPGVGWVSGHLLNEEVTAMTTIEAAEGGLRVVVAEPGKHSTWTRKLMIPLDP